MFKNQEKTPVEPGSNIVDFVVNVGVAKSKREAREFISTGAISINGEKLTDLETIIDESKFIENKYIVVKRGKKKYYLGEFN